MQACNQCGWVHTLQIHLYIFGENVSFCSSVCLRDWTNRRIDNMAREEAP